MEIKNWRLVPKEELTIDGCRVIEESDTCDVVALVGGSDESAEYIAKAVSGYPALLEQNKALVEALKALAKTDGSFENVTTAEVLAARVRFNASFALKKAGVE